MQGLEKTQGDNQDDRSGKNAAVSKAGLKPEERKTAGDSSQAGKPADCCRNKQTEHKTTARPTTS